MIYTRISSLSAKHPNRLAIAILRLDKSFIGIPASCKSHKFTYPKDCTELFTCFLHRGKTCSSILKFLSMRIPKRFCCLLPRIFTSPTFANVSYLGLENRKMSFMLIQFHIVWFKPFHGKGRIMLQSSNKSLRSKSQAWKVVSSA